MHNLAYILALAVTFTAIMLIFWLAKRDTLKPLNELPLPVICLIVLAALAFELIAFKVSVPAQGWDFLQAYYPAGQAMLHNDKAALRVLVGDHGQISSSENATTHPNLFVNIPVVAYLFAPFALLPPYVALILFTLIGIALIVIAWFWLVKLTGLEIRERWLLAILFLANGPMLYGVIIGNLSYFLLAALAGGLLLLRSGRNGTAGILLGLATVIKPPLALFGFFFLLRRDMRGLASYAATGIVVVLLSLALFGWADNLNWFDASIVQFSHNWLAAYNVQSLAAFILRFAEGVNFSEWSPVVPSPGQKIANTILTGMIFIIVLAVCYKWPRANGAENEINVRNNHSWSESQDLQYLMVICLCIVTSPLSWSHYYAWLLMPIAFFLKEQEHLSKNMRLVAWAAIALITPMQGDPMTIGGGFLMGVYRSLFMSHYLLGALILFGLVAWWVFRSQRLPAHR